MTEEYAANKQYALQRTDDAALAAAIAQETIREIYPRFYPEGAVEFFLDLHSEDNIRRAMEKEEVYILTADAEAVATATVRGNEIFRLFVLPRHQGQGYGTMLMDALENSVFEQYESVSVDASLPAENMYINRGYKIRSYEKMELDNGDFLCFHSMEKARKTLWKCVRING